MQNIQVEPFLCNKFSGFRVRIGAGGRGIPTPALADGRLIFGGGFGSYEVWAVNASTGALDWQVRTTDDGPTAVTLAEGYAAYATESCTLEVLDAASGARRWSHWLGDPLLAQPAIAEGRVFIAWPEGGGHKLGAFALGDGRPLWRTSLTHDIITAPVVAAGRVYVSLFDGHVACFDADSGRELWRRDLQATSAPWIAGEDVFVSQRTTHHERKREHSPASNEQADFFNEAIPLERTANIDARGGRAKFATAAKHAAYYSEDWGAHAKRASASQDGSVGFSITPAAAKIDKVRALIGEATISRTWRFQGSRPVVVDGVLYESTGDRLEARCLQSHALLWSWQGVDVLGGNRALTPPAVANGRVLAGTADGRVIQWDAKTGAVRLDVHVGAPVHWQPVMAAGRVAVGLEDGSLVAFETGDASDDGWPMWGGGPGHNGDAAAGASKPHAERAA